MSDHMNEQWPDYMDIAVCMSPNPGGYDAPCLSFNDYLRARVCVDSCAGIPTEKLAWKTIEEYVNAESYLTGMTVNDGLNIGLQGLACQLLASSFAGQFKANGAVNYLQVSMDHPETGPFTVTMQRVNGDTPAALQRKAEEQRDDLLAALEKIRHECYLLASGDNLAANVFGHADDAITKART
jgi:DNA-directed RNA polymerase subunit L